MTTRLRGAIAAAITPYTDGGAAVDLPAIGPLVDFYVAGGVDGLLPMGTTGEGILLGVDERMRTAEAFIGAAAGRLSIVVHCGAQTTADTERLAAHAAAAGADAVAVIGPPYYALDSRALSAHFLAAAAACEPLPFYLYEFAARTGYNIPPAVVREIQERAPNLRGMKVSNPNWDHVAPYLIGGLDLFVGSEPLIDVALSQGAVGTVSGLAAALPEVISAAVREPTQQVAHHLESIRHAIERFPFQAALKAILIERGLPIRPDVRRPLRGLDEEERARLAEVVPGLLAQPVPPPT